MMTRLLKAVIILPFNVLVFIPGIILYSSGTYNISPGPGILGILLAIPSIAVMIATVRLFITQGEGTPGPWDPPKKFVVKGPYCYVRNPMLIGVLVFLIAESLFFGSSGIFIWFLIFLIGNIIYFPFVEEKGLEKRFGEPYLEYKKNVPRWVPRLRPYKPD